MKEEDLKHWIQNSTVQTSDGFTDGLMDRLEALEPDKVPAFAAGLRRGLWMVLSLLIAMSFVVFIPLQAFPLIAIVAMMGLLFALNAMLVLRQELSKLVFQE